ncbi:MULTISPECIES: F0F1 ATP synthase subunit delta [Paenibacillus]|uniref:ATP synthase subunit delta n=1 Tax=Paenibacillus campinasensis TaxID=66347 RepID=A0ABW9T8L0_9BACL|nr:MULTISPECIES: F0F1 ATP synthase subunit delta [Paenibacillus]MUG67521.1 F0F1 ATP synthase subunit delta [Paenibacillus campinasensis]PAK51939.1 F0F1 ATP synthase subunit delta [Paenibacillus sp. 7541]
MSQNTVAAKRYARALFEVAAQQQKGLEVEEELRAIVSAIEGDGDIQKFIATPNIPQSVKVNVLKQALEGKVSQPVLSTLELLLDKGRTELFAELLNSYVKIQGEALGFADAVVYSTYPLNDSEKEQVAAEFGTVANKKIRVNNVVDKGLLGGLKVVIGDKLYDGSLAGKLERLEKSFNRRAK